MQASPTAFKVLSHPSLDQAGGGTASAAPSTAHPAHLVQSNELLKGQKTIGIMHNGSLYRLQATKLGKLILTK
ncbi:MAG TPA: hemin uptake protein HemP [Burkholderiaceae bacterium]|uniref:Hemin uptake protein HemP n=1 Tax=Variovorax paradoxus TaxID=34073 RepID=A0A2W5P2I5_VARPD|nr:MAG: hemin uptake protein HemP [Variovorax paradoxus]HZF85343.1 hemin uptake protein HemP [Burkholderiaceae bacterium]